MKRPLLNPDNMDGKALDDPKRYLSSTRPCDDPHANFQAIRNKELQWQHEAKPASGLKQSLDVPGGGGHTAAS